MTVQKQVAAGDTAQKILYFIYRIFYLLGYPLYLLLTGVILMIITLIYNLRSIPIFNLLKIFYIAILLPVRLFLKLGYFLYKNLTHVEPVIPRAAFSKPLRVKKKKSKIKKRYHLVLGFLFISAAGFAGWFWFFIVRDLPKPQELVQKSRPLTTHIYDRNGNLLFKIYRNQNRTNLTLAEIPLYAQEATIAVEDAEFYTHPGFSLRGIISAIRRNVLTGQTTGGSTITQQLVKNALLSPEKTYQRKLKEIVLSILTETKFSKQEILKFYFNEVSYGGTAYGIEEASQIYFGKSARDLTLAQATLLAGLPGGPTRFSPFGAHPELAKERQNLVLTRMFEEGYITPQQSREAEQEPLVYAPQRHEIEAPHFVMWIKQQLADEYGERMIEEGGLNVTTSLDINIQDQTQKLVHNEVQKLAPLHVNNGAALVTDPKTGEVLAMVGSADYFNTSKQGNFNVTTALRQPGSSIKPVNYSYALEHGYTPASIIEDSPVVYTAQGQEPYAPENYDRQFRGPVTLRTALASSLNVPAVKVLASYGVSKMVEQAKKLGVTTWNDSRRFGLSLTLGGGEVKMTDMNVVYGALANNGQRVRLKPILKVTDNTGKLLKQDGKCPKDESNVFIPLVHASLAKDDNTCIHDQAIDPRVAFMITDILHDNDARKPTFGPKSLLVIPGHPEVAVKTGTTQNLRDNWAIGYTQDYVVTAWVGNNDNTPMSYIASGVTGATPIWNKIMTYLLQDKPSIQWDVPSGLVKLPVCLPGGTLACSDCSNREEWFLTENQPQHQCTVLPPKPSPQE